MKFGIYKSLFLILVFGFAAHGFALGKEQSELITPAKSCEVSVSQTGRWQFGERRSAIIGEPRADFNGDMYTYLLPDEWEFLGKSGQDLHSLYDKMSPCKISHNRFWFGGCGGVEGGGFFQVVYGEDGLVNEVHYCASTCTASFCGPSFTDRIDALNYAIFKANKELRNCLNPGKIEEPMPRQFLSALQSRMRAYMCLGKLSLYEEDAKILELLKPLYVREKLLFQLVTSAGNSNLAMWKKEIQRNGIRIQSLSQNAYKLTDSAGKSFKLKVKGQLVSNWEEAEWFVSSAISRETKELMKKYIKVTN